MKVSIITRAFDRLEYTIKCINGVRENAGHDDYEHIIVNQGSRDGTGEWLRWITRMPNNWYAHVRPVHLKRNVGDFGGMKAGFEHASGDLIMQLDNDVYMETGGWLAKLVGALSGLDANIVMADRKGYKEKIPHDESTMKDIPFEGGVLRAARIPKAVSCYIVKRSIFEERSVTAKHCRHVTTDDNCWKVFDVHGMQIEGYDPADGSYVQHDKFGFQAPKSFLSKKFIFKHGRRKAP